MPYTMAKDLAAWLEQHMPPEMAARYRRDAPDWDYLDAIFWWIAYRQAESLLDCSPKDMARTVLVGIGPIDEQFVEDWIQDRRDMEEPEEPLDGILEGEMMQFFGILELIMRP
jgi:hypothetical protein